MLMWSENGVLKPKTVTRREATKSITLVPGVLGLRYEENHRTSTRFSESFPQKLRLPISIIMGLFLLGALFLWFRRLEDGLLVVALSMVLAGALASAFDRLFLGYLVNFIEISFTPIAPLIGLDSSTLPSFNLADLWLFIGTLFFVYRSFRPLKDEEDQEGESTLKETA